MKSLCYNIQPPKKFPGVRLIKEKLIVLCIFIAFGLVNVTQKAGIGFDKSYPHNQRNPHGRWLCEFFLPFCRWKYFPQKFFLLEQSWNQSKGIYCMKTVFLYKQIKSASWLQLVA